MGSVALPCLLLLAASRPAAAHKPVTLLNVSYDPTRELYQDVNAAFSPRVEGKDGAGRHDPPIARGLRIAGPRGDRRPGSGRALAGDVAYVRTSEVDLVPTSNGGAAMEAVVRHIRSSGQLVRLALDRTADGQVIEAELPRRRYEELGLRKGDRVFVSPRNVRVFIGDEARGVGEPPTPGKTLPRTGASR